jgi:mono/diheme cytochrome c family protein
LRRVLRIALPILAVAFVAIQFVRPERTNPPVDPSLEVRTPVQVQAILERSCYDCHSSETRWPWYSNIAPMSWTLVHDVEEGREEMSFSHWNSYSVRDEDHLREEICEQVEDGEMPLKPYTLMHPRARLSDEDRRVLCGWTRSVAPRPASRGEGGAERRVRGRSGRR